MLTSGSKINPNFFVERILYDEHRKWSTIDAYEMILYSRSYKWSEFFVRRGKNWIKIMHLKFFCIAELLYIIIKITFFEVYKSIPRIMETARQILWNFNNWMGCELYWWVFYLKRFDLNWKFADVGKMCCRMMMKSPTPGSTFMIIKLIQLQLNIV